MAKRLTETQKKEIIKSFTDGKPIDLLSQEFDCTKLTIIRNLKRNLGEKYFKELIQKNQSIKQVPNNKSNFQQRKYIKKNDPNQILSESETDFQPISDFVEITPLNYEIESSPRKELSSVPIGAIDLPSIVYMIVDKKIELETKFLRDYPEWEFLPNEDLDRECIEIYDDMKTAKRLCNKEQKAIKVPNTGVFKLVAPFLISRGISRIVYSEQLIAL